MKKLTSIKNPLFNTLERREMKHVLGGMSDPTHTATAAGQTITGHSDGTTSADGTTPANADDGPNDANA